MAAPGVGKSQIWLNLAQRIGCPTLYWSADTDSAEVFLRSGAISTGFTTDQIEQYLGSESAEWITDKIEKQSRHIDFVFDSPITGSMLDQRMAAFATMRGEWPALVVLDNLSNAIQNPADEYAEIRAVQTQAQVVARTTGAHVAILHHAKGEYDSGSKPIPQSGGLQNPFKIPAVGLTAYRPDEDDRIAINLVKLRGGKSDPAARHPITLPIDFSRASLLGYEESGRSHG